MTGKATASDEQMERQPLLAANTSVSSYPHLYPPPLPPKNHNNNLEMKKETTRVRRSPLQYQRKQKLYVAREKVYPLLMEHGRISTMTKDRMSKLLTHQRDQAANHDQQQLPEAYAREVHEMRITKCTKTTSYGTMASADASPEKLDEDPTASNQSETDSDSESSTGSTTTIKATTTQTSTTVLQSILRIPSRELACRTLKKKASVEFALDVDDSDDDSDQETDENQKKRRPQTGCFATRCMPRRLTLAEKAALYQVRPDLEITPAPFILHELEERRRRRQRKLMFSILGGTLLLLMVIVCYYLLAQA